MKRIRMIALLLAMMMVLSLPVQAVEQPAVEKVNTEDTASENDSSSGDALSVDDWQLLLVNPWNPLPEGYTMEKRKLANGLQVDARIYDDLNAMLIDCWGAGLHPIVCSAYRTPATQRRLYNNKIARLRAAGYGYAAAVAEAGRWVAMPGTSEHQTGMALDIVSYSYQNLTAKQAETAEQKWLMEHCWEYGFVLRYPKEKTEVTGIGYEPWHYRYVGRAAAMEMKESGLCLEEYLETLRTSEEEAANVAGETIVSAEPSAANVHQK